jgi:hypothetical protein
MIGGADTPQLGSNGLLFTVCTCRESPTVSPEICQQRKPGCRFMRQATIPDVL